MTNSLSSIRLHAISCKAKITDTLLTGYTSMKLDTTFRLPDVVAISIIKSKRREGII